MPNPAVAALMERLRPSLGERVSDAIGLPAQFGRSEAYASPRRPISWRVRSTPQEVRRDRRLCHELRVPIVPFGAGTSLEGNAASVHGGLCLDMSAMDQVVAVNPLTWTCGSAPASAARRSTPRCATPACSFPIDPGADASIGGMASTRGSGTMAVRYGTMRDNVLALEVVLPDGRADPYRAARAQIRRRLRPDAPLRRRGRHARRDHRGDACACIRFPRRSPPPSARSRPSRGAVETAIAAMQAAIPVARIELLDEVMMRGVNRYAGFAYPELPTLFIEFHGTPNAVDEQAESVQAIVAEHGGRRDAVGARARGALAPLARARQHALRRRRAAAGARRSSPTSACRSPRSPNAWRRPAATSSVRLARAAGRTRRRRQLPSAAARRPRRLRGDRAGARAARPARRAGAPLDGTCTGEHGVGVGKRGYLERSTAARSTRCARSRARSIR